MSIHKVDTFASFSKVREGSAACPLYAIYMLLHDIIGDCTQEVELFGGPAQVR
jgi:hypothetical protein